MSDFSLTLLTCFFAYKLSIMSHDEQSENATSCGSLMSRKPVYNSQNLCGHVWPKYVMPKFTESAVHPFH